MNIEAEKSMIIEQVKKIYDADLLGALKSMLDYAQKKEQKIYDIPETHQNLVMERFEKTRANPDMLLDWDEVRKTL
ncbi:MAG: hypothetical protein PHP53_17170 [Prolixibacteraceae bacterium]|nr:hypothetical protein [Prolixibacteraceae bacterium]